jgi:hypothetical protein
MQANGGSTLGLVMGTHVPPEKHGFLGMHGFGAVLVVITGGICVVATLMIVHVGPV